MNMSTTMTNSIIHATHVGQCCHHLRAVETYCNTSKPESTRWLHFKPPKNVKTESVKQINGYPNYYIFSDGKVYSKKCNRFLRLHDNGSGYRRVTLCTNGIRKKHKIHRLVALHFVPNPYESPCVDHIDRNKENNHHTNLRWCTSSENQMNNKKSKNNTSGVTGVYYKTHMKKYVAFIHIDGKQVHLGYFETLEDATIVRHNAERKHYKEFRPKRTPPVQKRCPPKRSLVRRKFR